MKLSRYFTYSAFVEVLQKTLEANPLLDIQDEILGHSTEDRPIYGLKLGRGSLRILAWSQMHGNESSTTRALINLLNSEFLISFLDQIQLYIIPILNPDGADRWSRNNANDVDLNRDAIELSQVESQILHKTYKAFAPHYCLNLHGQRSIYGNLTGDKAAQLSFLAPAGDKERTVTQSRLESMNIINKINAQLSMSEEAFIGRYSDAFNINCVGDYFTSLGTPTILFEAGHASADYSRNEVTELMTQSIKIAISEIANSAASKIDTNKIVTDYELIPAIASSYCDIHIRNMISSCGKNVDLSIMYQEVVEAGSLYFIPCITGINDREVINGHRVIDLTDIPVEDYDFEFYNHGIILSTTFEIVIFCE